MDKSNTLNSQDIEKAVNEAVDSVRKFTKRELEKLISTTKQDKFPLIIPVTDIGYIVGTNLVKNYKNLWYVASIHNLEREHTFGDRLSAIFYALTDYKRNFQLAGDIYRYDLEILRLNKKIDFYKTKIQSKIPATKRRTHSDRLADCLHKLEQKRFLLAKSLKMAKYYYL